MKDTITKEPLKVSTDGSAGPYVMVPVSQIEELRALFDKHRIPYSVDENAISLDDAPEIGVVNLGRGADAGKVQKLLDSSN